MKTRLVLTIILAIVINGVFAQLKKDGTPDMRYKANKMIYGNSSYSSPNYDYSAPKARYQEGYYNSTRTYVEPHYKTRSNSTNTDNYSTYGNVNPYTGQAGGRARDMSAEAFNYGNGYEIREGVKGGQYYINSQGKKVYVPKRY
jgi:hypothetical protein